MFAEIVHTDIEGYKAVDYSGLAAQLIEAVKELKTKIEILRIENGNLVLENNELKKSFSRPTGIMNKG